MLLALFLIDLAAGLYVFLPVVGRRNAGVKFYRLMLIIDAVLLACAAAAHVLAHAIPLAIGSGVAVVAIAFVYAVLRYPKRLILRIPAALLGILLLALGGWAWREATHSTIAWSIVGSLTSIALLGSVTLAMLLGHWYLVVRGMAIDPLKRLTWATLAATIARVLIVVVALCLPGMFHAIGLRQGIFFWMRAGWGLIGPLFLFPMVWGTVKIRSTMAATGILYVEVVAVVIGEVLGAYLATIAHLPV